MESIQILAISAYALSLAVSLFSHLYILFSMPLTLMIAYSAGLHRFPINLESTKQNKTKYIGSNTVCFYNRRTTEIPTYKEQPVTIKLGEKSTCPC